MLIGLTPGPHRELQTRLGLSRGPNLDSERSHHFTARNHARNHALGTAERPKAEKMPNQSISEAECKRLAQVLEPKALPARIRVLSHRRDRREGSLLLPGLPEGRSRCGKRRNAPNFAREPKTSRDAARAPEALREFSLREPARRRQRGPPDTTNTLVTHRTPARSTRSRPTPSRARGPARRTSRSGRASTRSSSGASRRRRGRCERNSRSSAAWPQAADHICRTLPLYSKNTFVLTRDVEHRRALRTAHKL